MKCTAAKTSTASFLHDFITPSLSLPEGAAGGDRPQRLDTIPAIAHVPVVEVHRRIAVAGDEAKLLPDLQAAPGVVEQELAVLVGRPDVLDVRHADDRRKARVHGE